MNIYIRISKLHSKSQQRAAWEMYHAEQKFRSKWALRPDNAAKRFALLKAELFYTFSQAEHDAARRWLIDHGWTEEEIAERLQPRTKTDAEEMEELLHIVLHESDVLADEPSKKELE
jgi:hypothetical protein